MRELDLLPKVLVPLEDVSALLAESADPLALSEVDPALCLMAATTYVLLAQGVLNYGCRSLPYDGALSTISKPCAEVLILRFQEAQEAMYLLLRKRWIQRNRRRLVFPKIMQHLVPHDFFARVPVWEIARRRRERPEIPRLLRSAHQQALEAYSDWSDAIPWAPADFEHLGGSCAVFHREVCPAVRIRI